MRETFITLAFLIAGLINFLPVVGVLGESRLAKLYGRPFRDADLLVLMRHRALLFGLIGGFMLTSIAVPAWRLPAGVLGLISMIGYIAIAAQQAHGSASLQRIALVDWVGLALLVPALLLMVFKPAA